MYKLFVWIGGGLLIVLIVFFTYQIKNDSSTLSSTKSIHNSSTQTGESSSGVFPEQQDEAGPVAVTVLPKFAAEDIEWDFELTLQTHSVELDMDLLESVVLLDADGSEVKPIVWNGDPPGGHHRAGTLRFAALDSLPETITLRVKNIADVSVREFVWKTQ